MPCAALREYGYITHTQNSYWFANVLKNVILMIDILKSILVTNHLRVKKLHEKNIRYIKYIGLQIKNIVSICRNRAC